MIITTDSDVVVKGNVGTNAVAMTIDPEAMEHIMSVLTNLYSNNHRAVAREYVANALDSHTEAGQTRPVEVISPSEWDPRLIVRDYGVGLTADEILNVYGVYGRSTRRSDNSAIGGLGLGSKSGFTLSGQFVVTGIKNGRKTVAIFSLANSGAPTMEILSELDTTEVNGVTISIAVDDVRKMNSAIADLSRTWPKDRVLVDGKTLHNNVYDSAIHIGNDIHIVDPSWGLTVDMGGVAYSVPPSIIDELGKCDALSLPGQVWLRLSGGHIGILARVPIGSVAIAPNRETLRNTPSTVDALQKIFVAVSDHYETELSKICEKATSGIEANITLRAHNGTMGEGFLKKQKWNGHELGTATLAYPHLTIGYNRGRWVAVESGPQFTIASMASKEYYKQHLFVVGVKPEDFGKVRRIATRYLDNRTTPHTSITVVENATGSVGWFSWGDNEYIDTMTLDEFRAAARALPSRSERNETRYTNYTLRLNANGEADWGYNYAKTAADIVDEANGDIYFGTDTYSYPPAAFKVGDTLVGISGQQRRPNLEKRLGLTLTDAKKVAEKYAKTIVDSITPDELLAYYSNDGRYTCLTNTINKLRDAGYSHKVLEDMTKEIKRIDNLVKSFSPARRSQLDSVSYQLERVDDPVAKAYYDWSERYVLIRTELNNAARWGYGRWKPEYMAHMVEYMKAIDYKEDKNV